MVLEWMGVQPLKSDVGDDLRKLDRGADGLLALLVKRVGIAAQKRSDRRPPLRSSESILLNRPNLITYLAPVSMETTAAHTVSPCFQNHRSLCAAGVSHAAGFAAPATGSRI